MSTGKRIINVPYVIIGTSSNPKFPVQPGAPSGAMSSTNVIISGVIDASFLDNVCVEAAWTGTPTGTFGIQGSVTKINWKDLGLSISGPAGSAGNILLDLNQLSFPYVRLVYTNISGTGTLTVYAGGKAL